MCVRVCVHCVYICLCCACVVYVQCVRACMCKCVCVFVGGWLGVSHSDTHFSALVYLFLVDSITGGW